MGFKIGDIWSEFGKVIQYNKVQRSLIKETNELLDKFDNLKELKKWLDFKTYRIRPDGLVDIVTVNAVTIRIEKDSKKIKIDAELSDGSMINEPINISYNDIKRQALEYCAQHKDKLESSLNYLREEIIRTENAIFEADELLKAKTLEDLKPKRTKKGTGEKLKKALAEKKTV